MALLSICLLIGFKVELHTAGFPLRCA